METEISDYNLNFFLDTSITRTLKKFLFIFSCAGSSLFHRLFLVAVDEQGPLSSCGVKASPCNGFSCCGARALGTWA